MALFALPQGTRFGLYTKRYRIFSRPNRNFCRPYAFGRMRFSPVTPLLAFYFLPRAASRCRPRNSRCHTSVHLYRDDNLYNANNFHVVHVVSVVFSKNKTRQLKQRIQLCLLYMLFELSSKIKHDNKYNENNLVCCTCCSCCLLKK